MARIGAHIEYMRSFFININMADVTISQLTQGTPNGNHLLPYSTGSNTLSVPVSAMFQNTNSRICINLGTAVIQPSPGLQINNGSIFISNTGGNQVAISDGPQRWDLDVDVGEAHALRIRNMTSPTGVSSTMLTIATAGYVTTPFQPAFHVANQTAQSITSNTILQFNATSTNASRVFNQGGYYANNRFTAPVDGVYQFSVNVLMNPVTVGSYWGVGVVLNSSDTIDFSYAAGKVQQGLNLSATIKLAANDYIEVRSSTDGTINIDNSGTFSGHLVG